MFKHLHTHSFSGKVDTAIYTENLKSNSDFPLREAAPDAALDAAQLRAARHENGPALIIAAPGSGKTRVIVNRVKYLSHTMGVSPENILVVTFSRAAACEMEARYKSLRMEHVPGSAPSGENPEASSPPKYPNNPETCGKVTFGTFHSVFFGILRHEYNYSAKNIISSNKKQEILRTEIRALNLSTDDEDELIGRILRAISVIKSQNIQFLSGSIPKSEAFGRKHPKSIETAFSRMPFRINSEFLDKISQEVGLKLLIPAWALKRIYVSYEQNLRALNLVDFDDMMNLCLKLLEARPDVLSFWQNRFRYILVDEFQDINPLQYKILKILAKPENNLFAVGDDDQSIYGFRGSDPLIMREFLKDFPCAARIELGINYRSSRDIVNAAKIVISENKFRFKKHMRTASIPETAAGGLTAVIPDSAYGKRQADAVTLTEYNDSASEYDAICDLILRLISENSNSYERSNADARAAQRHTTKGIAISPATQKLSKNDIAILVRSSTEAKQIAAHLSAHRIPFSYSGNFTHIFEHFIVKDMLAYMNAAQDFSASGYGHGAAESICGPHNYPNEKQLSLQADWVRIINKPLRYISREALRSNSAQISSGNYMDRLKLYYRGNYRMLKILGELEAHLRFLSGLAPFAAIRYIRSAIGYDGWLNEYGKERRGLNPEEIFPELEAAAKRCRNIKKLTEYIKDYSFSAQNAANLGGTPDSETAAAFFADNNITPVKLMTMHASKGLEFDTVILPKVNEGIIPHKKALNNADIEEERRVFYVAMTRAKRSLFISWSKKTCGFEAAPSRFIKPLISRHSPPLIN